MPRWRSGGAGGRACASSRGDRRDCPTVALSLTCTFADSMPRGRQHAHSAYYRVERRSVWHEQMPASPHQGKRRSRSACSHRRRRASRSACRGPAPTRPRGSPRSRHPLSKEEGWLRGRMPAGPYHEDGLGHTTGASQATRPPVRSMGAGIQCLPHDVSLSGLEISDVHG